MNGIFRHILLAAAVGWSGTVSGASSFEFNRDIRPILSDNCLACHGPDSAARKAGLRLDSFEGATKDGAIVPGNAGASELVRRIRSTDPDNLMPPPDSKKTLKPEEIEKLVAWIDAGANWQTHWAFIKPERPEVPRIDGDDWARNPIDRFIRAKTRELGMEQNGGARPHILARRAALDLTGLPPDPNLLADYAANPTDGAYRRYIDALLASEHSGEHRARFWLDAARYGDTHGMHLDNYREMWPYRDWVIDAFNANMPFDRFVVEQIAGDLLPDATLDQRIATGFNRCNVTTAEGGSIPEEVNVRYMVDRVETTSTVFLGLTAGCAVCHDHKYDPLTQRDFYSLGAFFNNTTQPPMDGNRKDPPPVAVLPDQQHEAEWNALLARREKLRATLENWKSDPGKWWSDRDARIVHPVADDDLIFHLPVTGADELRLPEDARWAGDHPGGERGIRFGKSGGLEVDAPAVRTDEPFSLSFWVRTPNNVINSRIFEQLSTETDEKNPKKKTTWGWKLSSTVQGAVKFEMIDHQGAKIDGLLPGDEALHPQQWQHVCVRYSGGRSKTSIGIVVNGREGTPRPATQSYIGAGELSDAPLKIAPSFPTGGLSDIRIYKRWLSDEEIDLLKDEFKLKDLLASDKPWKQLSQAGRHLATRYHRNNLDSKFREASRELAATGQRRDFIHSRSTTTLVSEEKPGSMPRAWVLKRGEYDQRGEEVKPDVPGVLPPLPRDAPRNRLGLARWLVNPENPLTARVMVNRLWQSVFGTGLVKTAEDLGTMGETPSHPELLDWLAVEFVESGWDINHLVELMVTSATYRQSSVVTEGKHRRDPANRFLARGPRLRLEAETLRDQALAVSGLLDRRIGGPSVRPYQPSGIWRAVAFAGSNTKEFKQDDGAALYRRSLYTFWKRTSPPPTMAAFDAPTREQCTVRRERTNTPLQALVLMNDPQYVEAARHFARRTLNTCSDDQRRAEWMFETALVRPASEVETADILDTVKQFKAYFAKDTEAAAALLQTGDSPPDPGPNPVEFAAWTLAANTLMNRDDFITKN